MKAKVEQRPVDRIFEEYDKVYKHSAYPSLVFVSVFLMIFGLFATVWAVPFPYIAILGKYNGYLNWASFLIAIMIYYYLKLSPMVSYLILFMLFGLSYGVIQLEQWQKTGGPYLWLVGMVILSIGLIGQLIILKQAKASNVLRLLIKAPTWIMVMILKAVKLKI